jgi:hypothetical protein
MAIRTSLLPATLTLTLLSAFAAPGCREAKKPAPWESGKTLTNSNDIDALAVDGSGIYFTSAGHQAAENTLRTAPLAGGPSRVLARGEKVPLSGSAAVDATHVYVSASNGQILRVAKAGGELQSLTTAAGAPEIAVDDTSVYFLTFAQSVAGVVGTVPKAGGPAQELARGVRGGGSLVLSPTHAYWTSIDGLFSVAKAGGAAKLEIANTPHGQPGQVAVDATHLYFSADPAATKLYRRPLAGGAVELVTAKAVGNYPIRVLGGHLYFVDSEPEDYALKRVAVTGGAPSVLGKGPMKGQLQVLESGVYLNTVNTVVRLGP